MKILAVGDPHFKLEYPYGDLISDGRRAERAEVLSTIHNAAKDCDAVVLMGDVFDKKHNHSSVIKDLVDFLDGFGEKKVYVISGNHETYEGSKTALDFLIGVKPNWTIITPANAPHAENGLGFVPYMTNASLGVSSKEEAREKLMSLIEVKKYDAIFMHHMVSGTFPEERVEEFVLPRERLEAASRLVVAGHIHEAESMGNTLMTGNMFSHQTGDHKKSVWVIDTDTATYKEVPLPVRPIYKMMNPTIASLDKLNKNGIIKVVLTEKGQDVEKIKDFINGFDAHTLVENYPDERERLHVEEGQTLDLSIPALLDLYATSKKKDPARLKKAFAIVSAA